MDEETRVFSNEETTPLRAKNERSGPVLETTISTSRDGKWIIHKTTITDIKPRSYWNKVLEEPNQGGQV